LLLSSAALQWATIAERQGAHRSARLGFVAGAVLSALFLLGQLWAWAVLHKLGYFLNTNPSSSFFYLLTAVHGLHLLGGLIVAAWTVRSSERLQLFVTYWHFLTAVWVVLFGLIVLT
jgi:cytochrome c oxidase subunit 3